MSATGGRLATMETMPQLPVPNHPDLPNLPAHPDTPTGDDPSLDPADWHAFRTLAHRMLDDSLDHIAGRREQPV